MLNQIRVIHTDLFDGSIEQYVQHMIDDLSVATNRCIAAVDGHVIYQTTVSPAFKQEIDRFYTRLPDGMPLVWIAKAKGARSIRRCYGPDFFAYTMAKTANLPVAHFFCGGKEGIAESLRQHCQQRFHNPHVVGTFTPPFREMEEEEIRQLADTINQLKVNILWIGIGCPRQERLALRLSAYTQVSYIVTVGAAFDFHTGHVKQAPRWLRHMGLEWLFRLFMEPSRLWSRYSKVVPTILWEGLKDIVTFYIQRCFCRNCSKI